MITPSRNKLALRTAILAALAAGGLSSQAAFAADGFAIEDNELTITGGGASASFSQTATLSANGVVSHISDVPSTDGVGIPSFSFDLITSGLTAGDYDFRVAVVFDKQGSTQSRIEAKIESLILNVSAGGAVTGRIPGSPNALRLLGRNGNGALEVQMNVTNLSTNGPVSISGNSVTFDGARLIQRIRSSNPSFDSIILEEFDESAAYDYRIIVQQKSGPETITFSTELSNVLTALPKVQTSTCAAPCATATDVLILNANELAAGFTNAYSVTGSFNVVPYVSPSPTASPSASPSPSPSVGGGGGGSDPTPTPSIDFDLDDLLGDLENLLDELEFDPTNGPSQEQLEQLDQAFGNLENQLANAQQQLESGTLSVDAGFNLLNTGGQTFLKGGEAAGLGGPIDVGAAAGTLGGFADVIAGMVTQAGNGSGLSPQQITQIASFTEDKLGAAANMISLTTTVADVEKMMESTADLINKTLDAGAELSPELVTAAVQIALKAVNNIAGDVVGKLGLQVDINDASSLQNLLRSEPAALSQTIQNTPAIQSRQRVDANNARLALSDNGIDAQTADTIVAALGTIVNPTGVALPGGQTATGKLLSALSRAFGGGTVNAVLGGGLNLQAATSFAVDVDAVTGALRVRADAESYAATSTAVRLVPATIPEGISYLADGRAVAVADGVAIELAPAAADVLGFAAAVQRAGFPATFRTDGSVALALSNNQRFSGTFAYDNIGSISSNCGAISFSDPQGAVNSASYAFTLHCANGITQRILPFVDNSAFYTAVANAGLTVRTDRNTGAITIGTVGRFKPSFFVTPLTTADQTYLTQVGTNGFAFRSRDENGDGRADYEVISSTGVQILYAMP